MEIIPGTCFTKVGYELLQKRREQHKKDKCQNTSHADVKSKTPEPTTCAKCLEALTKFEFQRHCNECRIGYGLNIKIEYEDGKQVVRRFLVCDKCLYEFDIWMKCARCYKMYFHCENCEKGADVIWCRECIEHK